MTSGVRQMSAVERVYTEIETLKMGWWTVKEIATRVGADVSTVWRHLKVFERLGKVESRPVLKGKGYKWTWREEK